MNKRIFGYTASSWIPQRIILKKMYILVHLPNLSNIGHALSGVTLINFGLPDWNPDWGSPWARSLPRKGRWFWWAISSSYNLSMGCTSFGSIWTVRQRPGKGSPWQRSWRKGPRKRSSQKDSCSGLRLHARFGVILEGQQRGFLSPRVAQSCYNISLLALMSDYLGRRVT